MCVCVFVLSASVKSEHRSHEHFGFEKTISTEIFQQLVIIFRIVIYDLPTKLLFINERALCSGDNTSLAFTVAC